MDWTKAKTILIVALLITNLILLVTYNMVKSDDGPTEEQLQAETIALLEEKQIYVMGNLPTEHTKMPVLMVEYDRPNMGLLRRNIAKQTAMAQELETQEEILKMTQRFLESCQLWNSNVIFDRIDQNEGVTRVFYKSEYEGIQIENSYMSCIVENGIVTEVDRFWLNPIGFGQSKKSTISASAALINLMRSKDEREAIYVEEMEMVYWLNPTDYEGDNAISDTALPAWKVRYNSGEIKYVPAYRD